MKGLRGQENQKFNNFFALVQEEAAKKGKVFFCDCGQGKLFENDTFECEDLCGWLIPQEKADEFEKLFLKDSDTQHEFDDLYCYIDFSVKANGEISIIIDDTPSDA